MRRFLLPNSQNNYTPYLLHRSALVVYVLVIFLFNIIVGQLGLSTVQAAVDAGTLYSLHNSNRSANGLSGLTVNSQLASSATSKAQAMLSSDCWDHFCPPGTSPWSFILNAGYEYIYAGENLGEGFTNSSTLMNAWMNSPTHRANVLSGNFTEIGIGFAYGNYQGNPNNTVVVVHFGSREKVTAPEPTAKPVTQVTTKTVTPTSKPAPKATSIPVVQPTEIPGVVITDPQNGTILNTKEPDIKGTKPNIGVLDILINGENVGRVDSTGENFSFRPSALVDGAKTLKVVGYINDKQVNESAEVNFTIDTVAPIVNLDEMEISYGDEDLKDTVKIKINSDEDTVTVTTNLKNEGFIKALDGTWEIEIEKKLLEDDVLVGITLQDLAGNQSIIEIPSEEILGYFDHNVFLTEDYEDIELKTSGSLLSSISTGGVQSQVNFAFILFLFALFMLDFYIIHKSGLTGVKRSKSHLHMSAMIILLLVIFIGGFGGTII